MVCGNYNEKKQKKNRTKYFKLLVTHCFNGLKCHKRTCKEKQKKKKKIISTKDKTWNFYLCYVLI